jgi:seryl-tRNA synthetase
VKGLSGPPVFERRENDIETQTVKHRIADLRHRLKAAQSKNGKYEIVIVKLRRLNQSQASELDSLQADLDSFKTKGTSLTNAVQLQMLEFPNCLNRNLRQNRQKSPFRFLKLKSEKHQLLYNRETHFFDC